MIRTTLVSFSFALLALSACKKGDDKAAPAGEPGAAAKPSEPAKPAAAKVWKKIPSMGIEVEVPADADVQDGTASAGFPSSTIYGGDAPTTFIFGAKGDLAESMSLSKDFDSTKARVQKEMNGFKSFTKEDKTADGFHLEYSGADMLEPTKSKYGVTIRSVVGELTLDCQTNASTPAEIAQTVALCKTIRAAK